MKRTPEMIKEKLDSVATIKTIGLQLVILDIGFAFGFLLLLNATPEQYSHAMLHFMAKLGHFYLAVIVVVMVLGAMMYGVGTLQTQLFKRQLEHFK